MSRACNDSAEVDFHRRLVEAAVLAPTPDNNQPWRFVSRGERLEVFLDPARALPSDVHSMFDLVGLGAAVENIRVAARHLGHEATVDCADGLGDVAVGAGRAAAATLRFQGDGKPETLFANLESRCTCRSMYSSERIDDAVLAKLAESAAEFAGVRVDWITDRSEIGELAGIVAGSDRIRLEYEPFHAELFRQLRFSLDDVETTRDGLDVRTLGLPPGGARLLGALRRWNRMRFVHRLGLGWLLTMPSSAAVRRSGAIGVLSLAEPGGRAFIEGGQALQRIWLTADAETLAMQPLGSLPIFLAHLEQLGGKGLPGRHVERIDRLGQRFGRLVPAAAARTLLMLFRLGRGRRPQCRSLRRAVEDVFE